MDASFRYPKVWQTLIREQKYTLGYFFELALETHVEKNRYFSTRKLALKSVLSPSMMTQVMKGQRHISDSQMTKIFSNLEFAEPEQKLFSLLLKCSKASDSIERELFNTKFTEIYYDLCAGDDSYDRYRQVSRLSSAYLGKRATATECLGELSMPFDSKNLANAKKLLEECFNKLREMSDHSKSTTRAYQGFFHFFPVEHPPIAENTLISSHRLDMIPNALSTVNRSESR